VRKLLLGLVALILVLTGCKGSTDSPAVHQPPEDRLAEAKQNLDAADYIGFSLTATGLPDGLAQGLLSATGTGTHAPAFTGEVKVQTNVTDITAPLVAVDGQVFAKFPFVGWNTLNPADYGAPDPAKLMADDVGISSLFVATTNLTEGATDRAGDQIVTGIDGQLAGSAIQALFPSAGAGVFTVNYTLTDDNDVVGIQITGPFYGGDVADVTYVIDLNPDADAVDIQAPSS